MLTQYLTDTRRLLHDLNSSFYTDAELTDFINEGRKRIAGETGCLRNLQTFTLTGQESYGFSSLPSSMNTLEILNLTVLWGNQRIPLNYMAWTEFNAELRPWTNLLGRPQVWSMYGESTFYVGPTPDQSYSSEFDSLILPNDLVTDATAEQITYPFSRPVPFIAAHLAKFKEQQYDEADRFLVQYDRILKEVAVHTMHRRIRDVYSTREIP